MEQLIAQSRALLHGDEVDRKCGLSRSQRFNLIKTGKFPAGFRLAGTRRVVWDSIEIENWIAGQVEAARTSDHPVQ